MQKTLLSIVILLLGFQSSLTYADYGTKLCQQDSNFICYTVKKGQSWASLFSNEAERDLVMRINRINVSLYKGMKIAIPKDMSSVNILDWSPMKSAINPPGKKVIIVSLSKLAFGAYDANGSLVYWGPVSGGKGYCPDIRRGCHTATGQYAIYNKGGSGCVSTKYPVGRGGAPMPYCMFFYRGFALHGSYQVPGYNASHGCVRMFVNDARWLNTEFTAGEHGVKVIVNQ